MCMAITAGYYMNAAIRCANESVYKCLSMQQLGDMASGSDGQGSDRIGNSYVAAAAAGSIRMVHIHPSSSFAYTKPPEYVVYKALVYSSKLYMQEICRASGKDLMYYRRQWQHVDPSALSGGDTATAIQVHEYQNAKKRKRSDGDDNAKDNAHNAVSDECVGPSAAHQPKTTAAADDVSGEVALAANSAACVKSAAPVPIAAVDLAKQRYLARKAQR